MRVKLTGIIEVEVEVETEIEDEEFYEWAKVDRGWRIDELTAEMIELEVPRFLRDYSDFETEIWANAPGLEDGDVLTAEFIEAEILD